MKKIEVIPLAEIKLKRRGIEVNLVKETVSQPMQVIEGYGGRKVAQRILHYDDKKHLLRVVYEETEENYVVITAYVTSQVSRYWKEER